MARNGLKEQKPVGKRSKIKSRVADPPAKNHRFQSFSDRVKRVKIKPVRPNEGRLSPQRLEQNGSYFQASLQQWQDQNLSADFTIFAAEAGPLCRNLPTVLHNATQIVDLLLKHLGKGDVHSSEPLLDLIAQLAHDLGMRFYPFFQQTTSTICGLASSTTALEVTEWSFNCLAALFVRFQALLVADLLPLYDVVAPILGKERQKGFVARFAAQAFSFLIRKVASKARADNYAASLREVTRRLFEDLSNLPEPQRGQFRDSVMITFADAMKGTQRGVREGSQAIVQNLLDLSLNSARTSADLTERCVEGILTCVAHHCDAEGFAPIVEQCMAQVRFESTNMSLSGVEAAANILYTLVAVRKGSRLDSNSKSSNNIWQRFLLWTSEAIGYLATDLENFDAGKHAILRLLAAIVLYIPLNYSTEILSHIERHFSGAPWNGHFLEIVSLVAKEDNSRFNSILYPYFQSFIVREWENNEERLHLLLPRLLSKPIESPSGSSISTLITRSVSSTLHRIQQINLGHTAETRSELSLLYSALDLIDDGLVNKEDNQVIFNAIRQAVCEWRHQGQNLNPPELAYFAFGRGPLFLASSNEQQSLPEDAFIIAERFSDLPDYLRSVLKFAQRDGLKETHVDRLEALKTLLIDNLAASAHVVRSLSVQILDNIHDNGSIKVKNVFETILAIENAPVDVQHQRQSSLGIKRLSTFQHSLLPRWVLEAMCSYCFGVLHIPLTPLWDDACTTLATLCSSKEAENWVIDRAVKWLSCPSTQERKTSNRDDQSFDHCQLPADFQCSNIASLDQEFSQCINELHRARPKLRERLQSRNSVPIDRDFSRRSQALKILNKIPSVAERRSRLLVPLFLNWFGENNTQDYVELDNSNNEVEAQDESIPSAMSRPSRADQKALLRVFSQFSNPTVLSGSKQVHECLLRSLSTGDPDVQRESLKSLFAWQSPSIKPYEQNLLNLLDDKSFRDELAVFVSDQDGGSSIRMEDKSEVMQVIIRLIYGKIVAKAGSKGHSAQEARRRAALVAISQCGLEYVGDFISLALGPLDEPDLIQPQSQTRIDQNKLLRIGSIPIRTRFGIINMILNITETLSNLIQPFAFRLMNATLISTIYEQRQIQDANDSQKSTNMVASHATSQSRALRTNGVRNMVRLFSACPDLHWSIYQRVILQEIIQPRLPSLATENAQSVSAILRLFAIWASDVSLSSILVTDEPKILQSVIQCLHELSTKDEVALFVLNAIVLKYVTTTLGSFGEDMTNETAKRLVNEKLPAELALDICEGISSHLEKSASKPVLEAGIQTFTAVMPFLTNTGKARDVLAFSVKLLDLEHSHISPKLRGELLRLFEQGLTNIRLLSDDKLYVQALETLSNLFGYFLDAHNRTNLCRIFTLLVAQDEEMKPIGEICSLLNIRGKSVIGESPDQSKDRAFALVEDQSSVFSAKQWHPLVNNFLFLVRDDEHLSATRMGASMSLRTFVKSTALKPTKSSDYNVQMNLMQTKLVSALRKGMREPSDRIRSEYVSIMGEIVAQRFVFVAELAVLLGFDEGTSFFKNIISVQQGLQMTALRDLAKTTPSLSSDQISKFLIPLVETIARTSNETAPNVANEAIKALDVLSEGLEWFKYRQLLIRLTIQESAYSSKWSIRTIGSVVNALHRAHRKVYPDASGTSRLCKTFPEEGSLKDYIRRQCILPKMMELLHFNEESSVDLRITIATIAVKLILMMPLEESQFRLSALLSDICSILRSKAQEARDAARTALAEIANLIGPTYLPFIVKSLKSALQRGSQLHVLTFTAHTLLLTVVPNSKPTDLDDSLTDLVPILIDDIFGTVYMEKEATEYVSSMKEVKKRNLGMDSIELLASNISPFRVSALLEPLREHFGNPRTKQERIDEYFSRLADGLRRNTLMSEVNSLKMCHEILTESLTERSTMDQKQQVADARMASFAWTLLRRILDKYETLKTTSKVTGFLPLLKRSMNPSRRSQEIQIAAMRFLSSIIKLDIPSLDTDAEDYFMMANAIIEDEPSVASTMSQSALRLISAILRDRPKAVLKKKFFEAIVASLLKKVQPDLQDPAQAHDRGRQVAAFNFLKAVLGRGVLIAEVYEVMDTVRDIMIKSPVSEVRNTAWPLYSRFLLDYFPSDSRGWRKQQTFLEAQLAYEHPSGRQSVMNVINHLLEKDPDSMALPFLDRFWDPLLVQHVTDGDRQCREFARIVLLRLLENTSRQQIRSVVERISQSLDLNVPDTLQQAAFEAWDIFFEVYPKAESEALLVIEHATSITEGGFQNLAPPQESLIASGMRVFERLCTLYPKLTFSKDSSKAWQAITGDERSDSTVTISVQRLKLTSRYLIDFAKAARDVEEPVLPLIGSGQLVFDEEDAQRILRNSIRFLEADKAPDARNYASHNFRLVLKLPLGSQSQAIVSRGLDQVCTLIRSDTTSRSSKLSAIKLLAGVLKDSTADDLRPAVNSVLLTLNNLTDPAVTQQNGDMEGTKQMIEEADQLLSMLRGKIGDHEFLAQTRSVQKEVKERREQRKAKRSVESISQPEKALRKKQRKHEATKMKRKERNAFHAGRRRGF